MLDQFKNSRQTTSQSQGYKKINSNQNQKAETKKGSEVAMLPTRETL